MKFKDIIVPGILSNIHYNGWSFIINQIKEDIIDTGSHVILDSFADSCFWNKKQKASIESNWIGIVHSVAKDSEGLHNQTLFNFVNHPWFVSNKNKCIKLITLSKYTSDILQNIVDIPVQNIYHPKTCDGILFNSTKYFEYPMLIHAGLHSRNIVKFANFITDIKKRLYFGKNQWSKLYVDKSLSNISHTIEIVNDFIDNSNYINLLTSSIGFAYYSDVGASNGLLEHIMSHTPIVVNKHPAVIEYIGNDYPLFYEDIIDNADSFLLDQEYIEKCSSYLAERSRLDIFSIEKFKKDILDM